MADNTELLERNKRFASTFTHGDMKALPKLGTVVLTCIDGRVDPAHVIGLELGDCAVIRNNGGRATDAAIEELTALSALVAKLTGKTDSDFHIVLMQHTKCGAQAFADPEFQSTLKANTGIDVSQSAIRDQKSDLFRDIDRLRDAPALPGSIMVSALLYDVEDGLAREISSPRSLEDLRKSVDA